MKWVTRERPVIDRIACPWLIAMSGACPHRVGRQIFIRSLQRVLDALRKCWRRGDGCK